MKRRDFLGLAVFGGLTSALPVVIAAFFPKAVTLASAEGEWQKIGTITTLDRTGELFVEDSPIGPVIVLGTSKNPQDLIAINPTCTHNGCTTAWQQQTKTFNCPCHGAAFKANGEVLNGPAKRPLERFTVKIKGNSVLAKPI
jgi:cytochrome b6-f complex iron-sulfur subunit